MSAKGESLDSVSGAIVSRWQLNEQQMQRLHIALLQGRPLSGDRRHLREDRAILQVLLQLLELFDEKDGSEQLVWEYAKLVESVVALEKLIRSRLQSLVALNPYDELAIRMWHKDSFLALFNEDRLVPRVRCGAAPFCGFKTSTQLILV